MNSQIKIWKYSFLATLGFHALYQFGFAINTLLQPQSLEALFAFNALATPESYLLLLIVSFGQFLLTVLAILALYWTNKSQISGVIVGMAVGCYFLLLGIVGIITVDYSITLLIDVIRGLLTLILGFTLVNKFKNQTTK